MSTPKYLLSMSSLVLVTGFVYALFLFPFVRTFHIKGDDFVLIFNSARQYRPDPVSWVTRGYSSYFGVYPDLPQFHSDFCRPVVNATFWLESLLSPGTGPLNLTTNLLGFIITLILFTLFARREANGNTIFFSSMFIVYAFSTIWYKVITGPSIRSNLLMALFALAAFLLLPSVDSRHQRLRISLSILCQLCCVLSHETGIVAPVIAALLFAIRRDGKVARGRLKALPVFLLPLFCFVAIRLTFYGGVGRAYVLEPGHGWVRSAATNTLVLLTKPFFPWDPPALTGGQWSLGVVTSLLMNLAGYALVAYALLRPGKEGRRPLLRVLLCLVVALVGVWLNPAIRFMQLAAVFGVLATIVAAEQVSQQQWARRGIALGLAGLAAGQLLVYLTSFPPMMVGEEGQNRLARVEYDSLRRAIATASAPTLLLVNDTSGGAGGRAMLEMAAWSNRGLARRLITVDGFAGESDPQSTLRVSQDNQAVRIEIVAGQNQRLRFSQVDERHLTSSFVNQGLDYELEIIRWYSFTARLLRSLGMKSEPDNASIGRQLAVMVPPEIARDGLLIVGFDPTDMSWFSSELRK